MLKSRLIGAFLLVGLISQAESAMAADLPAIAIPACGQPPILDGKLADPVWQTAVKIENLYQINSDIPAPETEVWLLRDNAWLYLGLRCRNANMEHVSQKTLKNEGQVNRDESVEFFIRPSTNSLSYCHFMLSFANVRVDRLCEAKGRDAAWDSLWRTSAARQGDGWTAEAAIPLFSLASDDLSGAQINILRNFIQIGLDDMGAVLMEKRVSHALKPGNQGSAHAFANYLPVNGLGGFKPEVPFAPRIKQAAITGVIRANGTNYYALALTLATATPEQGTAQMQIIENFGDGDVVTHHQTVELPGTLDLNLNLPAGVLRERKIKVVLADPADGNLLASLAVDDTSALKVLKKVVVGRSYYTSEDAAEIMVELGLPEGMLPAAALRVEIGGGKNLEIKGLQPMMIPAVPLPALAIGDNMARVSVLLDERELAAQDVKIIRLAPRPGYETKADYIKGVILKDNRQFFPVGLFGHTLQRRLGINGCEEDDENLFRFLAEDIGLNTIIRSKSATNTAAFMNLAQKYGLNVITWTSPQPYPIGWKPGMWPPPPCDLPLAERLAIQQKAYDAEEPEIIADTRILRDYKNFIAYYNVDEPNLVNPEERIAGAERYWNTVAPLDPYRPQLIVYSAHIPPGGKWTKWCDILGYDIYPKLFNPDAGRCASNRGWLRLFTSQLRERCRQDNKIMWFVPVASQQDPARTPIGMDKLRMICCGLCRHHLRFARTAVFRLGQRGRAGPMGCFASYQRAGKRHVSGIMQRRYCAKYKIYSR